MWTKQLTTLPVCTWHLTYEFRVKNNVIWQRVCGSSQNSHEWDGKSGSLVNDIVIASECSERSNVDDHETAPFRYLYLLIFIYRNAIMTSSRKMFPSAPTIVPTLNSIFTLTLFSPFYGFVWVKFHLFTAMSQCVSDGSSGSRTRGTHIYVTFSVKIYSHWLLLLVCRTYLASNAERWTVACSGH